MRLLDDNQAIRTLLAAMVSVLLLVATHGLQPTQRIQPSAVRPQRQALIPALPGLSQTVRDIVKRGGRP